MKKIAIAMLAVLLLVSGSLFTSCKTSADDITVKVSFEAGDDSIPAYSVKLSGDGATVIRAVQEAISQKELNVKLNSNEDGVASFKNYTTCTKKMNDEDYRFYWSYTINGKEPREGSAAANTVADGDVIKYVFYCSHMVNDKAVTEPYNSEMNMFGENADEETAEK